MKKSLLTLLGAGLLLTSCQSDEPFAPVEGGEKQVTFTLNVPGELGTRAGATDNASDKGGWSNTQGNVSYTLVLSAEGHNQTYKKENVAGNTVTFSPTVVLGREYTVTAYAHFNATAQEDLTNIIETKGINDESKDVYFFTTKENVSKPTINFADGTSYNFDLKRPYAKLRLIAEDYNTTDDTKPKTNITEVTVSYNNEVYTVFNAVEGEFNTKATKSYTKTWNADYYEKNVTSGDKTIFADYIPVNGTDVAPFTIKVKYSGANNEEYERVFAQDIPVRRNALTTLSGNFFTAGAEITVEVDDDFEGGQIPGNDEEQLIIAAAMGGEVTLTEDVVLDAPLNVQANMTINLNGKTIKNPNGYAIENYSKLTISGDGNMSGLGGIRSHGGEIVINGGTFTGSSDWNNSTYQHILKAVNTEVTINGGTFDATIGGMTNAMINVSENSVVTINAGTFKNVNGVIPQFAPYMFTYEKNGKLIINGGEFYGGWRFNGETATTDIYGGNFTVSYDGQSFHANSTHVLKIYGGTFSLENGGKLDPAKHVAAGYKVVVKDGKYVVVANSVDNVVASKVDVQSALKDAVANGDTNIELDANGAEINLDYGLTKANVPAGTTVTLRNANVEGRSYGNGVDGTIIFENCTFKNTGAYSIHFDNGNGNVIFKNCELYGWNSFGSSLNTVEFHDSKLFGNGTYALIRSYVNLTLKNCIIDTTEANHEDAYSEGVEAISPATLTEKNVTYVVSNAAALQEAIQAGKDVVLSNDLTISESEMLIAPYGNKMALSHNGGVFDGNGKTISATMGGDNYAVMTNGGTIKNLTIDNGFRGIVIMSATQTINLENVVSSGEGVCYALNTAEGTSTQDLVAKNCTFNGWSSWSLLKSATFTNCKFGQGTYYTNVYGRLGKPYVNTLFDGCNFCSKYYIDLSALGANQKVTLKNCTVNGVKITAENWTSLVAPEDTCGEGQISVELKNGTYLTAENVADYIVFE